MMGISLNGSTLPIDPKLFTSEGDYGVVTDSGSQYSLFVDAVYQVLRKAMVSYFMDEWLLQPLPLNKTRSKIDLCYDITDIAAAAAAGGGRRGGLFSVAPPMVFQIDGGNLELNQETNSTNSA